MLRAEAQPFTCRAFVQLPRQCTNPVVRGEPKHKDFSSHAQVLISCKNKSICTVIEHFSMNSIVKEPFVRFLQFLNFQILRRAAFARGCNVLFRVTVSCEGSMGPSSTNFYQPSVTCPTPLPTQLERIFQTTLVRITCNRASCLSQLRSHMNVLSMALRVTRYLW